MKTFQKAWSSYRSQRLKNTPSNTRQLKMINKIGDTTLLDKCKLINSLTEALKAINCSSERKTSFITNAVNGLYGYSTQSINTNLNKLISKASIKGLIKLQSINKFNLKFKLNLDISLTIIFITTKNFLINKNLSISN